MATPSTGRPTGRPARPVESKRLAGNPGKRPLPDAPAPGQGLSSTGRIPTAPKTLQAEGKRLWKDVWEGARAWLAPDSDFVIVRRLCEAWDEAQALREALSDGTAPRWYETPNGQVVTHPAVTQLRNLDSQITSWLSSLGFSPSDRARLGLGEVRVNDPLDELAAKRGAKSA